MSDAASQPSKLLLDECFAAEDERFLDALRKFSSYEFLLGFVQTWLADPRPWARRQMVRYLQSDLNDPGHEVVFKRLLKHFEAAADHEMMGHFLVASDRLVRRKRQDLYRYDPAFKARMPLQVLFAEPNRTVRDQPARVETINLMGRPTQVTRPAISNCPENRLFAHRTRSYVRRRVWRYFRRLGYGRPAAYVAAISTALCEFRDADFTAGENILDNWSLMHACFFHHDAICFTPAHANLVEGRSLSELAPAPFQPQAWQTDKGAIGLLQMITAARSSLVRMWALELLQREHGGSLDKIDVPTLITLLGHVDPRVQEFAAELFQSHAALSSLGIETWLELLDQSNQTVLSLLCEAMRKHVSPARLDNGQVVALACARPVPVARLGLEMIQQRHTVHPFSRDELARLAGARCPRMAGEIAAWTLRQIGTPRQYDVNYVIEFFDSMLFSMRAAALDWLVEPQSPGYSDPVLWSRLVETPQDDVRFRLIDCLERRTHLPGQTTNDISQVWTAVILGVQRGGRTKLKAVHQVAAAIQEDLSQADRLLPVLAVAVRSVRAPERRGALSAVVTLVVRHAELRELVARELPELQCPDPREALR